MPPSGHASDPLLSLEHGSDGAGLGLTLGGGGGVGFVGPMFTTKISMCSSPVVTLPPVLPPELTSPVVMFVMPPDGFDGGGTGVGVGSGLGVGVMARPDDSRPRSTASRSSACALKAIRNTERNIIAIVIPSIAIEVVFVILLIFLLYYLPETDTHNVDVDHIEGGCI